MAVTRQGTTPGESVVEERSGTDVGTLPDAMFEGHEERNGANEMRAEPAEEQGLFGERLADQAELELLEVAEATVNQFARAARRARGPVALFEERDRQPPTRGIECRPRADDTATDDDHVEGLTGRPFEIHFSLSRIELHGIQRGGASLIRPRRG